MKRRDDQQERNAEGERSAEGNSGRRGGPADPQKISKGPFSRQGERHFLQTMLIVCERDLELSFVTRKP